MNENMMTLEQTIEWLVASGVDETFGDEPYCLNDNAHKQNNTQSSQTSFDSNSYLPQATVSACQEATKICEKTNSLEELKQKIIDFDGCAIKQTATSTVFGEGSLNPKIMFITEAPGTDEDRYGTPFAGKNLILLEKMIKAAGFEKNDCYFATILPWRPPGNRTPTEAEISISLPFIKKQIELVKPQYIFCLGGSATNHLLDFDEPISKIRGKFLDYKISKDKSIELITSFHPQFLLKNPEQKAKIWQDLLKIRKKFL